MPNWIPIEKDTPLKPEVFAISNAMQMDPDMVFGKLVRMWMWFAQMSANGHTPSVTKKDIDALLGAPGFADAVHKSGWLEVDAAGITMVNFDYHCGKSAKRRKMDNRRKSVSRSKSPGSVRNVSASDRDTLGTTLHNTTLRGRGALSPLVEEGSGEADQPEGAPDSLADQHSVDLPTIEELQRKGLI